MNVQVLKTELSRLAIPKYLYSLPGERMQDDSWCLRHSGEKWDVFYTERGHENGLRDFSSEEEACLYLLDKMNHESSVNDKYGVKYGSPTYHRMVEEYLKKKAKE